MTKVYVIRHAEAEGNIYRRMCGQYNGKLTSLGEKQLDRLEKRFEGVHIDKVYTSDLERARRTSEAVTRSRGMTPVITRDLREVDGGEWEYVDFGTLELEYPEDFRWFNIDPARCRVGERFDHLQNRMKNAVLRFAAENDGGTIALFSHGAAIRSLTAAAMGVSSSEIRKIPYHDNTSVALLNVEGGSMEVVYDGDATHLGEGFTRFGKQDWYKTEDGGDNMDLRMVSLSSADELSALKAVWDGDISALQRRAPGEITVALRKGEPAAFVAVDTEKYAAEDAGLMDFFFVFPRWRERYAGPQLIGEAVARSRAAGRKWLMSEVAPGSGAEGFLKNFGFAECGKAEGKNLLKLYIELEKVEK